MWILPIYVTNLDFYVCFKLINHLKFSLTNNERNQVTTRECSENSPKSDIISELVLEMERKCLSH